MKVDLKIFKAHQEAIVPRYATENSSCFDIHACFPTGEKIKYRTGSGEYQGEVEIFNEKEILMFPGCRVLVPTGLIFDIPENYSLRLHPRSGLAWKNGITLANGEGVVDEDYIEPVYVILHNTSGDIFKIKHGDRICQAELILDTRTELTEIFERPLAKSSRNGGFGSTGN